MEEEIEMEGAKRVAHDVTLQGACMVSIAAPTHVLRGSRQVRTLGLRPKCPIATAADWYQMISFLEQCRVNKPGVGKIGWVEDHYRSLVPNWKNIHFPHHTLTQWFGCSPKRGQACLRWLPENPGSPQMAHGLVAFDWRPVDFAAYNGGLITQL